MGRLNTSEPAERAEDVAALMRMFEEHRLLIVCKRVEFGEANASSLAKEVGPDVEHMGLRPVEAQTRR